MGFENHFAGTVRAIAADAIDVQAADTTFKATQVSGDLRAGDAVWVYFRSEAAQLATEATPNSLPVTVLLRTFQGNTIEYVIQSDLGEFKVRMPEDQVRFEAGPAYLSLNPDSLIVMPK